MREEIFDPARYPNGCRCASCEREFVTGDRVLYRDDSLLAAFRDWRRL